ncbi:hypothetical protein [Streptomyces qinglanensis]|uniref:hypothetical protein n=1 Tax=Streptomyces qinglanensis TaxID=943816 RepID=UPI000A956500|nr:hypothetical protein [Streptomyces qinglanensis]
MPDEALAVHLRRLGLDADEEALYRAALAAGPCTLEQLASRLDRDPALVQAVAERLIGLGLLAGSGDSRPGVVPLEPAWALERLLTARSAELQDARLAAADAYRVFRRTVHPPATEDLVEVVTGDRIRERIHQAEAAVEHEVLRLDPRPTTPEAAPTRWRSTIWPAAWCTAPSTPSPPYRTRPTTRATSCRASAQGSRPE